MAWEVGNQKSRKKFRNVNEDILKLEGYLDEKEAKIWLYKFLRENPTFACQMLSGVELFPFQHMAVKAMMETDYFLGIWCLEENEYVLSENGFKKIKDLKIGDYVRSRENLNLILDKKTNEKSDGLEVILHSGDCFKAKLGHKTLVFRDFKFQFEKIENLKEGDIVPIKIGTNIWGNNDIFDKFNLNEKQYLFYWLGYVLGDGYIDKNGVHYCSEHAEVQRPILEFLRSNNLKLYTRQRNANLNFYEYSVFNRDFVALLESMGWDKSLKSNHKIICDSFLTESKENLCALIGGLFDSDGYASYQKTNSKVGLKNTSLQLLRQVKMLLNNLGIESFLRKSGKNKTAVYYDLVLSNDYNNLKIFQNEIDFIISHKRDNLQKIINRSSKRNYQNKLVPNMGDLLKKEGSRKAICNTSGPWGKDFSQNEFGRLSNISIATKNIINSIKQENVVFSSIKRISSCEVVSVDITVDNEECYIGNGIVHHNSRGFSKTWSTGIFAFLDAILNQGVTIGIISKSFRQSRMIFQKIEDIAKSPKAAFLAQCITDTRKSNDQWVMEIGRSKIIALPLGDGEKLRGFRFQRMIIDELLLMPEKILNEVIIPFLSVVENPTERQKIYDLESKLIAEGKMTEDDRIQWPNNKIIGLSSASYKFEHLYKMYETYEKLIRDPDATIESSVLGEAPQKNNAHRVIMHFSYDLAPTQLYDANLLNQAKATLSQSQFDREFRSIFTDDSDGYFKVKKMKDCVIPDGTHGQSVEIIGDPKAEYILSFDPSWSESASSDNFAMHVIKLTKGSRNGVVVHTYAIAGTNLKKHIFYFHYLLTHFNIVGMVGDYNGAVQFISACNESQLFKDSKIEIKCIDVDFDDPVKYAEDLKEAKKQYNKDDRRIAILRKPSSSWIRQANEMLQAAFDHKKILFAASAMDNDFDTQQKADIPIDELTFMREMDASGYAKKIDFIEHVKELIDGIRVECALIEVTTSPQGTQSFDLPLSLKKQSGENRPRKDSYSALVLGNWMMNVYYDMIATDVTPVNATFVPRLIK